MLHGFTDLLKMNSETSKLSGQPVLHHGKDTIQTLVQAHGCDRQIKSECDRWEEWPRFTIHQVKSRVSSIQ